MVDDTGVLMPNRRVSSGEPVVAQLRELDGVTVEETGEDRVEVAAVSRSRSALIMQEGEYWEIVYRQRRKDAGRDRLDSKSVAGNYAAAWLVDETACCADCGHLYDFELPHPSFYCRPCRKRRIKEKTEELSNKEGDASV